MKEKTLLEQITCHKRKMENLAQELGVSAPEVIDFSIVLDQLINKYMGLPICKDNQGVDHTNKSRTG
jgi:hypothetical protein